MTISINYLHLQLADTNSISLTVLSKFRIPKTTEGNECKEQLNNKLKTGNFETKSTSKYNIAVPKKEHLLTSAHNVKAMYISFIVGRQLVVQF